MFVKQISVFIENTKGSLSRLTRLLSKGGVDLIALSIADTENYGIMRCIVSDTDKGVQIMREAGYVARLTDVLAVSVPDQPGGLANVLTLLNAADVSVEYLYYKYQNNENKRFFGVCDKNYRKRRYRAKERTEYGDKISRSHYDRNERRVGNTEE